MQPPKPALKIAALVSFVLLVAGFVAYRSGYFNRRPKTQTVIVKQKVSDRDTQAPKDSNLNIMHSSKPMPIKQPPSLLPEKASPLTKDSSGHRKGKQLPKMNKDSNRKQRLYSSKSALIIDPAEWDADSSKNDH